MESTYSIIQIVLPLFLTVKTISPYVELPLEGLSRAAKYNYVGTWQILKGVSDFKLFNSSSTLIT